MDNITLVVIRQELCEIIRELAVGRDIAETVVRLSAMVTDMADDIPGQDWLLRIRGRVQVLTVYWWWRPSTLYGYLNMRSRPFEIFRLMLVTDVGRFVVDPDWDGYLYDWVCSLVPRVQFYRQHVLLVVTQRI